MMLKSALIPASGFNSPSSLRCSPKRANSESIIATRGMSNSEPMRPLSDRFSWASEADADDQQNLFRTRPSLGDYVPEIPVVPLLPLASGDTLASGGSCSSRSMAELNDVVLQACMRKMEARDSERQAQLHTCLQEFEARDTERKCEAEALRGLATELQNEVKALREWATVKMNNDVKAWKEEARELRVKLSEVARESEELWKREVRDRTEADCKLEMLFSASADAAANVVNECLDAVDHAQKHPENSANSHDRSTPTPPPTAQGGWNLAQIMPASLAQILPASTASTTSSPDVESPVTPVKGSSLQADTPRQRSPPPPQQISPARIPTTTIPSVAVPTMVDLGMPPKFKSESPKPLDEAANMPVDGSMRSIRALLDCGEDEEKEARSRTPSAHDAFYHAAGFGAKLSATPSSSITVPPANCLGTMKKQVSEAPLLCLPQCGSAKVGQQGPPTARVMIPPQLATRHSIGSPVRPSSPQLHRTGSHFASPTKIRHSIGSPRSAPLVHGSPTHLSHAASGPLSVESRLVATSTPTTATRMPSSSPHPVPAAQSPQQLLQSPRILSAGQVLAAPKILSGGTAVPVRRVNSSSAVVPAQQPQQQQHQQQPSREAGTEASEADSSLPLSSGSWLSNAWQAFQPSSPPPAAPGSPAVMAASPPNQESWADLGSWKS